MRVAQLTCVYPPYGGGIGEVTYNFAALLAAEHQVTVLTPRYTPNLTFTRTPGVRVEAVRPRWSLGKAAVLPHLLARLSQFDVVHLHYPFFGVHEWLPKLPSRTKFVITYHMVPMAPGLKGWLFRHDLAWANPRLAQRAARFTAATKDYMEAVALPAFGHNEKWTVLPFGVAEDFHPGQVPERLERQYKIRYGEVVVLFVATLDRAHAFKGLDVLLKALAQLQHQTWRLVVVGGGQRQGQFEQLARQLKVQRRVDFAGFVSPAELPDYYRLAKLFVLPSVSQAEAFGLAALQAMASGLPVVASRLPGVRELVREGDNGLLVPAGDPVALAATLDTLLAAPQTAVSMGARGTEIVAREYRWAAIGEKLKELYRQL